MIGNVLQPDLEEMIAKQQWKELREGLEGLDPSDIAELIVDLPPEDEGVIFRVLPRDVAGEAFNHLPVEHQETLIQSLGSEQSRTLLEQMPPDDRVRLLEEMPAEVTRRLLETLKPAELAATRTLLGYPEHTAGRYMTPEYVALRPTWTVSQALDHIRATGRGAETLAVVYIVDDKGFLRADLRLADLVLARPKAQLAELPRAIVAIPATTDREELVQAFEKYDRAALPVIDAGGHMLGIITADDVLDVAALEATEDMQKLGGQQALDAPYLHVGFWSMVRKRGGWLAIMFLGEMLTATAMGYFEGAIEKAAVVALFVPLIISSGGNSGSQGTSLIIRALAVKELRLRDWWRVFGREIRTGLALGIFLGLIGFCRIGAWQYLSTTPYLGPFFQTHAEQDVATIPTGFQLVTSDTTIPQALTVPTHILPAGARLQKGQLLPTTTALPTTVAVAHPGQMHPTAYGPHWRLVGLTVFLALVGVVAWGSLAGSMLPFALRSLGFDPATSSAPFVATLVDVTGLIIYFLVAKAVLSGTLL